MTTLRELCAEYGITVDDLRTKLEEARAAMGVAAADPDLELDDESADSLRRNIMDMNRIGDDVRREHER